MAKVYFMARFRCAPKSTQQYNLTRYIDETLQNIINVFDDFNYFLLMKNRLQELKNLRLRYITNTQ